jgi:hypothetical protein
MKRWLSNQNKGMKSQGMKSKENRSSEKQRERN